MLDSLAAPVLRTAGSFVAARKSGAEIEDQLDDRFAGEKWSFQNYTGDEVSLEIESITVRAKYSSKKEGKGVQQVEGDNMFTALEQERTAPTFLERLSARLCTDWVTRVRLYIDPGGAKSVRPSGLSLQQISARKAARFEGTEDQLPAMPAIRIADTADIQSDMVEMKISYSGSPGRYRRRLNGGIDILEDIQQNMDEYVISHLMELHHSGQINNESSFNWPRKDAVRKLARYLLGEPVDLDEFADYISEAKQEIQDME